MQIPANSLFVVVLLFSLAGVSAVPVTVHAQSEFTLDPESKISIDGTSTRSDWTVHAEDVTGTFDVSGDASGMEVSAARLTITSANIKSGKSTIMDRLMHDALMVDEHPEISYELTAAEPAGTASSNGSFSLNTTGRLTLTGTTRDVQIDITGTRLADGKIRFTGSHAMKMSDYGMAPPTAMFGQLRTGDDIVVHFDVVAAPTE